MEYVSRAARAGPRASERWGPYDGQNLSRSIIFLFIFLRGVEVTIPSGCCHVLLLVDLLWTSSETRKRRRMDDDSSPLRKRAVSEEILVYLSRPVTRLCRYRGVYDV